MVNNRQLLRRAIAVALLSILLVPAPSARAAGPSDAHSGDATAAQLKKNLAGLDPELKEALANGPNSTDWPDSNYARLLDLGNITVKSDGTTVAKYRLTYKLFNERARDLAEVNLPYNSSYQEIHVISARTIKKDGTIIAVKPQDIRTTAQFGDYLMYDDAQGYGFSMPGIEDNCIIDYTWEEITHPMMMPGQFTAYWGFSGAEPVGVSRLVLHIPADKRMKYKVYNDDALKPVVTTSLDGKIQTYTWEKKNLKPLDLEPSMPRVADVSAWMEVSSLDSWQDIAHWFWGLQAPQAKATDKIHATVAKLIENKQTDEEKARAIYDWVANRTRYVGLEFGLSAFRPHAAADVHDKLYGDCKDKATLLITMLDIAGIKANPVLLHAEDRRKVDDGLPTLSAFNHCIALATVAGKEVWLDATAEACAYGDIPAGDRGARALIVSNGVGEFKTVPLYGQEENGVDVTSRIDVKADGSADTQVEMRLRGESGQGMRARARATTPEQRKQIMQGMAARLSTGATIKEFTLPDGTEKNGPFVMRLTALAPHFVKKTGRLLLLPLSLGIGDGERSNPYTQDKRVWPIVEEDAVTTNSKTVITLPDGYAIEDIPGDVDLVGPLQEYHRKLTRSADGKTITVTATVVEHPGSVPAADYPKIKAYYDELLKSADDQVVLKKLI